MSNNETYEMPFHLPRKYNKVEKEVVELKKVGRGENAEMKKVKRTITVDEEVTNTDDVLKEAQKEAKKQGYADVSLEEITDTTYKLRFYNKIDLPRTPQEKKIARDKIEAERLKNVEKTKSSTK